MRELTKEERRILEEHEKWLIGEGGERADFSGTNLREAKLFKANLREADLCGVDLCGADLCGAKLFKANLREAELQGADLRWANLYDANLYDANLYDVNLRGAEGVLSIGPIGSRHDLTYAFVHNGKAYVRCGCFSGTLNDFSKRIKEIHGDSSFGKEYEAAIAFIKEWASIHFGVED